MLSLGRLTDQDCWLLVCQETFYGRALHEYQKLEDSGVVVKYNGLPFCCKDSRKPLAY